MAAAEEGWGQSPTKSTSTARPQASAQDAKGKGEKGKSASEGADPSKGKGKQSESGKGPRTPEPPKGRVASSEGKGYAETPTTPRPPSGAAKAVPSRKGDSGDSGKFTAKGRETYSRDQWQDPWQESEPLEEEPPQPPPRLASASKGKELKGNSKGKVKRVAETPSADGPAAKRRQVDETEENVARGEALVFEGQELAVAGETEKAYKKYCMGLQYLLDVMPDMSEEVPEYAERRERINAYLAEAEQLKAGLVSDESPQKAAKGSSKGSAASKGKAEAPGKGQTPSKGKLAKGAVPEKGPASTKGASGEKGDKGPTGREDAVLQSRINECEAVMQEAYSLEADGSPDEAYDKYCTGLRHFMQAMRKLGEESQNKDTLRVKVNHYLSKAEHLKGRLQKAGITVQGLLSGARPGPPQAQPQRSRSPHRKPAAAQAQQVPRAPSREPAQEAGKSRSSPPWQREEPQPPSHSPQSDVPRPPAGPPRKVLPVPNRPAQKGETKGESKGARPAPKSRFAS